MIRIIDFVITKIERHTKDKDESELYRQILNLIDKYKYEKYKITTFRYYRYKTFSVDDIEDRSK